MNARRRRIYTQKEIDAAVAVTIEVGGTVASQKLGIPRTTLQKWKQKALAARAEAPAPEPVPDPVVEEPKAKKKKVARHYTPSERAVILEYTDKHGPMAASREFGVSRYSIHDWRRKVAAAAAGQG